MRLFLLCFILVSICTLQSEDVKNSLIMVRCDSGSGDAFLDSPQDIDTSALQQNLDPYLDTVVLIHGFNTSYNSAKGSYTQTVQVLASKMGRKNYIGFYWPSDTWLDFGTAVGHANKTGAYLMHVLSTITKSSSGKIHLVCHSLGARALLATLQQNEARYINWGKTCFLAAAVNSDVYFTSFSKANLVPQHNYVFFSKNDGVLKYLYALYSWLFDRGLAGESEFFALPLEEKIEYMRNLEQKGIQRNISAFDRKLLAQIRRAEKDAMGLVGSFLGNSKELRKVDNIEVSDVVNGHSYWNNSQVIAMVAGKLMYEEEE